MRFIANLPVCQGALGGNSAYKLCQEPAPVGKSGLGGRIMSLGACRRDRIHRPFRFILIQSWFNSRLAAIKAVNDSGAAFGRHIVEFEQGGSARAEYGARLLQTLASSLAAEFGRGFDASNLRHMRVFYQAFPIRDALRPELSWTHYRALLRVERDSARQWYMNEAASQGWTTRSLERQISTLYYERLLAASDRPSVENEARGNLVLSQTPRDFVRDPVMLEFLGLPGEEEWRYRMVHRYRRVSVAPSPVHGHRGRDLRNLSNLCGRGPARRRLKVR